MCDELKACLPTDSARQVNAMYYARMLGPKLGAGSKILDVGCGTGASL